METAVVTGIGMVSPIGIGVDAFWANLIEGKSGVRELGNEGISDMPYQSGGVISEFEPDWFTRRERTRLNRCSQMALVAAKEAVENANWDQESLRKEENNVATLLGVSAAGFAAFEEFLVDYINTGNVPVLAIPLAMTSGPAFNISIYYGLKGPTMVVDTGCTSSAHAIGYALTLIRYGLITQAVIGGADTPLSPRILRGWAEMRLLGEDAKNPGAVCKPFSANRTGTVLGEGAIMMTIEAKSAALKRGHKIYAEIAGYGTSSDAYHLTQPSPAGQALAVERALKDANILSSEIDFIHAHGTGTKANDSLETEAIKMVLGTHAYDVPIVSTKGATGHLLGGSSALGVVVSVLSICSNMIPPTINYEERDSQCDLDYNPNKCRSWRTDIALVNSFAFGGNNCAIVVKRTA